jgi:hypothetical protein
MLASLKRSFSLYSLLAVLIGAQGAVLLFIHNFGSAGADSVCGSILLGLGVLAFIGHGLLASVNIPVPAGVYNLLLRANGVVVIILAATGTITQYVGTNIPALTPTVAVILQGLALAASLFAGLIKVTVSRRALVPFAPH